MGAQGRRTRFREWVLTGLGGLAVAAVGYVGLVLFVTAFGPTA